MRIKQDIIIYLPIEKTDQHDQEKIKAIIEDLQQQFEKGEEIKNVAFDYINNEYVIKITAEK